MGVPTPVEVYPWDIAARSLFDDASVVFSTEVLPAVPRPSSVYELHNIHMSMSEDGTGDLASMGIADGPLLSNAVISNTDGAIMGIRSTNPAAGEVDAPSLWWHFGRSNQLGPGSGSPVISFPPGFYWARGIHGIFQNGAGAGVEFLWTVIFRVVRFRESDFAQAIAHLPPRTGRKERPIST